MAEIVDLFRGRKEANRELRMGNRENRHSPLATRHSSLDCDACGGGPICIDFNFCPWCGASR
jgi:hypothetical protein